MRAFACGHCGALVFFENSLCLRCSSALGFVPERLELSVLPSDADLDPAPHPRRCANATSAQCNWLVGPDDPEALCFSCRLTRTRPADADASGLAAFATAEAAKRRLLFQLLDLPLPIGADLKFDLLSSQLGPVVTGHDEGVITIDLAESIDARREQRRAELGEPYRTILGHFRHEIGHYYWPLLVPGGELDRWRALFGDEREDYDGALQRHYELGPPADWSERHVSAYATMHPWEDWAETFAHYLHIRDTLQTAHEFGLLVAGPVSTTDDSLLVTPPVAAAGERSLPAIVDEWLPLTYALNQVNRSMGYDDLYPFTLAPRVIEKLSYVHERVLAEANRAK